MPKQIPNIKVADNKKHIHCLIRKKWIILTPEEKVRQFILHKIIDQFSYPLKYISVEKTIKVNALRKRYDIVVYNQELQPKLLIECKAEYVEIKEKTLQQIATYNIQLQVPYLMVSNGKDSFFFQIIEEKAYRLDTLPDYHQL